MKTGPIFLAAGIALLAGLFVAFKPGPAPIAAAPPAVVAAAVAPAPKVFELTLKDGKLASGDGILGAVQGDEVVLRVTSDKAGELHVHGYDLELKLTANTRAELKFTASRSGRFEYELHGHGGHGDLGALEIQPR